MIAHRTHHSAPAALEANQFNQPPRRERQSNANAGIVLHDAHDAKTKLLNAKTTEGVVTTIMALAIKKPALMSALTNSICSNDTAKAVARRYSLHPSVLSYWSKRVGLPKRRRGRRPLLQPTPAHLRILELVLNHGITGAARRSGVSKQRVHQIVCRWAPELGGRRRVQKVLAPPPRERRPRRQIVVSFRISSDEWHRLLATPPITWNPDISRYGKARAILLAHLVPSGSDGNAPAEASASPASGAKSIERVNVYNQQAA